MRSRVIKASSAAIFAIVGMACGGAATNQQPTVNTSTATPAAAANASTSPASETAAIRSGKDLYTINCMTCHKDSGKGGKVTVEGKALNPDDLTSAKMKAKTDEKLYSYIADGIVDEGMPAFKDTLKPEEIRSVVAHLRALQGL